MTNKARVLKAGEPGFKFCEASPLSLTLHAKLFQSCPTLCDPMDCSWPGSSVHGISQARTRKWVAISFSIYCLQSESHSVVSDSLQRHGLYSPWNSPGQNTRVGSLSLLQGIFPTQELNPGLLHCRRILYLLSHKGSPSILEWVAYLFSRGSSQPSNRTGISCIAGRFFKLSYQGSPANTYYMIAKIGLHFFQFSSFYF